ncbi:AAA family ATPase [Saccharibacillus endophyticus]|uniref:Nuclease SbcCD subunit C n=1 Tax=Saccharibacillus endophyticus TaxID=2060666 RepID=A0ABQ1ZQZ7_9BACL|nr:AAA family ATPase [Saccharibacillus endophyticus]GGH74290.1 nuclease SbcCD subunit C [Saccharibacillus endophyticus]
MKPITLKLSGLQSYREAQEVDFTELCETGLFGIFGPTGSGKSTVLDAITLAMYGKVERAYGGTQGIMNHSEDTLFVSFTFELESSAGVRRFRVERRFKRTGEVSVSNTLSRFIEVKPEGDDVVADKLADVTRAVEERIGLKMDDFTRAVVLPQGKFAEFLSLKGSDRRQMLQRLFHLEQYGDRLIQKLNKRTRDTEGSLRAVEAEQQGLGLASAEAVEEAEKQLSEASVLAGKQRKSLDAVTAEHNKLARVREHAGERDRVSATLEELRSRDESVRELQIRAERGRASALLLPTLERFRAAAVRSNELTAGAQRLRIALDEAKSRADGAISAENQAREALTSTEPRLLRRTAELEQGLQLEQELKTLRDESERLERGRNEAASRLQRARQDADDLRRKLEQANQLRTDLQEKLDACEVRSADRAELESAGRLADSMASLEEQLPGIRRDLEEAQRQEKDAETELAAGREQEQSCRKELECFADQAHAQSQALHAFEAELSDWLEALATEERRLEHAGLEHARHRMAAELSQALNEGDPCPVCGATHHPLPAGEDPSAAEAAAELEPLRAQQLGARELRLAAARLRQGSEALARRLREELAQEPGASAAAQAEAGTPAPGSAQGNPEPPLAAAGSDPGSPRASAIPLPPQARADEFVRLQAAAQAFERDSAQLEGRARDAERAYAASARGAEAPRIRLDGAARQRQRATERLNELEQRLSEAEERWKASFAKLRRDELERRREDVRSRDTQAEELKQRLEKSVPVIRGMEETLKSHEEASTEAERSLVQFTAQAEGRSELLKEKELRLNEVSGGASVAELLREATERLQSLRQAAQQTRLDLESAREAWQLAANASAAAEQAVVSAAEHASAAEASWNEALSASLFATEQEAESSRMAVDEITEAERRVQHHREREREWSARLRELETLLEGVQLSEEQWADCAARLEEARRLDEEALAGRARAQRDLEDVSARHGRWSELEAARVETSSELDRLSRLQTCFRGNAFVEYVAEEQLIQISRAASNRLRFLTKQRYSLEVDSNGGFVICDDANGGVRRPVSTLSGGETFLTSLSLALALSAQIQLRGEYPLQFFFLDEGFGTLDPELLDTVITSLEHLHNDRLSVGVISHVQELRARLPRRLVVQPADHAGAGSKVVLEKM